jgi:hypothetical protein
MMGLRSLFIVAAASIAAACSTAPSRQPTPAAPQAVKVDGMWELRIKGADGQYGTGASISLTQTGGHLAGKMFSVRGEVPLTGTIKGNAIAFGYDTTVQGQSVRIDHSGIVAGDTMHGQLAYGSFGGDEWTATRKQ